MATLLARIGALLGLSTYQAHSPALLAANPEAVETLREQFGGQLAPLPTSQTRWYMADLEDAIHRADRGDLSRAAQLYSALRRDGTARGLLATLTTGVIRLPRKFYGSSKTVQALQARNGSRSVFDDMFPPSELALLAQDGDALGVGVAELLPVEGRSFPVMCRLEPEFLLYRWNENRWYYRSFAGLVPITPGDGRWILHTPGGRIAPWRGGTWPALGRSFINKEHALLHRANYGGKLANPARAAVAPVGASESQRKGFLQRLIAWGVNSVFELPPGWDVRLIESNGRGYEVFQAEIDTSDREYAITIAGQVVTVDGGAGFSNADVHRTIRADKIQALAGGLAYTLNTQGIPPFIATHFGERALGRAAIVEWDVSRPKDLATEANALVGVANAITTLSAALKAHDRELDVGTLLERFGVPVRADDNGDGIPDDEQQDDAANDDSVEIEIDEAAE